MCKYKQRPERTQGLISRLFYYHILSYAIKIKAETVL